MHTQLLNKIGQRAYSTKETLLHSYNMGKYVTENNIQGVRAACDEYFKGQNVEWLSIENSTPKYLIKK